MRLGSQRYTQPQAGSIRPLITTSDSYSEQSLHIALHSTTKVIPGAGSKQFTLEELQRKNFFTQTTCRTADGRYDVELPFNSDALLIGESFNQAKRRFLALERRLQSTGLKQDWLHQLIQGCWSNGIPTEDLDKPHQVFYFSHHNVMKDSSTHKLRMVFDGSAKSSSGWSLNASLLTGPTLQDNLTDMLRFRFHTITLRADVEKMYRQV